MSLNVMFDEKDLQTTEEVPTGKALGGTELMQMWLHDRLDPELVNYFQWIASRKRKLEDKPRLFWVHDLAQDPEVQFLKGKLKKGWDFLKRLSLCLIGNNINMLFIWVFHMIMV